MENTMIKSVRSPSRAITRRKEKNANKASYAEGDLFLVPLAGMVFALGRIVRASRRRGTVYISFFHRVMEQLPDKTQIPDFSPQQVIFSGLAGDLGLIDGSWKILRGHDHWDRRDWPLPRFKRRDLISDEITEVEYDDSDVSKVVAERKSTPVATKHFPEDGLMGSKYVEEKLRVLFNIG